MNGDLHKLIFDDQSQRSKPSGSGGRVQDNASNNSAKIAQNQQPNFRIKKTLRAKNFKQLEEDELSASHKSSMHDFSH